jgi:hypothetical protein
MRGDLGHFTFVVLLRAAHPLPPKEDLLAFPRSFGDTIPNSGRVADARPGIKTCQTLARHSTLSLTICRYAKTTPRDIKGAVESLPNPTSIRPKSDAADLAVSVADETHISMRIAHRQPTGDAGNCRDSSDDDVNADADAPLLKIASRQENKATDGSCREQSEYRRWGSNPHGHYCPEDSKSSASAMSLAFGSRCCRF